MAKTWSERALREQGELNRKTRSIPNALLDVSENLINQAATVVEALDEVPAGKSGPFSFMEGQLGSLEKKAATETMYNLVSGKAIAKGQLCLAHRVMGEAIGEGGWVVVCSGGAPATPDIEPPKTDTQKFCELLALLDAEATLTGDYAGLATECNCPSSGLVTCESCVDGEMASEIEVAIADVQRTGFGLGNMWADVAGWLNDTHTLKMHGCSGRIDEQFRSATDEAAANIVLSHRREDFSRPDAPAYWFVAIGITNGPKGFIPPLQTETWRVGSRGECTEAAEAFPEQRRILNPPKATDLVDFAQTNIFIDPQ